MRLISMSLIALCFGVGCAMPKVMVANHFVGDSDKLARHTLQTAGSTGGQDAQELLNYYIQVCDAKAGGSENCKTTLILENVTLYRVVQ